MYDNIRALIILLLAFTFVGRQENIQQLLHSLEQKRSVTLLAGEAGIGKSALLEQFYNKLLDDHHSKWLIGFYDQSKSLIGESQPLLYPFVAALESLVNNAVQTEEFTEKVEATTKRIEKAFVKFAKKKGVEIAGAIIHDRQ